MVENLKGRKWNFERRGIKLGGINSSTADALTAIRRIATRDVAASTAAQVASQAETQAARYREVLRERLEVHLRRGDYDNMDPDEVDPNDLVTPETEKGGDRARALNDPDRWQLTATTPSERAEQIVEVVNYLNPESDSHDRYITVNGNTWCNIYAYDFCYLCDVYIPRVWWTSNSLRRVRDGESVTPSWGQTVDESNTNANSLYRWIEDFGARYFGWEQVNTVHDLQVAANGGEICLISVRRAGTNGHIAAVVPEHDDHQAHRSEDGVVIRPLQSQAGTRNYNFSTRSTRWWLESEDHRVTDYAFWRNPGAMSNAE